MTFFFNNLEKILIGLLITAFAFVHSQKEKLQEEILRKQKHEEFLVAQAEKQNAAIAAWKNEADLAEQNLQQSEARAVLISKKYSEQQKLFSSLSETATCTQAAVWAAKNAATILASWDN